MSVRTGGNGNFHYLLITKYMPGTVVNAGNTAMKETKKKSLRTWGSHSSGGD